MKICICTTPIRPIPTTFPPFGSMAIIQALEAINENPFFYNIDYHRYSEVEIKKHFKANQYDVIGISSVVSTAYAYTKYLVTLIKKVSPNTIIVLGGNLGASAEILLRKAAIDICVVGDGEKIIQHLINNIKFYRSDRKKLLEVKGIAFLDNEGGFNFTGNGEKPSKEEIEFPDYRILEKDGSIDYFISNDLEERILGFEGELDKTKTVAMVVMNKGCVARCTFCHRFEKGYRAIPNTKIINHISELRDKYNVGYIQVADENFGADRKATSLLVKDLGELGIPWQVAGVRVRTVTAEALKFWKKNGCYLILFGIESGSPKILSIMEKGATLEENINAIMWTSEANLSTVIQLVLGMPGENDRTIHETIDFIKLITPFVKIWKDSPPSESISINYAQALPGTPLYEFARRKGFIGDTIDDEEDYLIKISDTDAYKEDHFVNNTGLPLLKVLIWRPLMLAHIDAHYYHLNNSGNLSLFKIFKYYFGLIYYKISRHARNKIPGLLDRKIDRTNDFNYVSDSGYFNIKSGLKFAPLLLNPLTKYLLYPLLVLYVGFRTSNSPFIFIKNIYDLVIWTIKADISEDSSEISLRKTVKIIDMKSQNGETDPMKPLRDGR